MVDGLAGPFDAHRFSHGHAPTNYKAWFMTNEAYEVDYEFRCSHSFTMLPFSVSGFLYLLFPCFCCWLVPTVSTLALVFMLRYVHHFPGHKVAAACVRGHVCGARNQRWHSAGVHLQSVHHVHQLMSTPNTCSWMCASSIRHVPLFPPSVHIPYLTRHTQHSLTS